MKKYKVREYHKTGHNKGNLKQELFFDTLEQAEQYHNSVFVYSDFSLNPTVWKYNETENEWERIMNY